MIPLKIVEFVPKVICFLRGHEWNAIGTGKVCIRCGKRRTVIGW